MVWVVFFDVNMTTLESLNAGRISPMALPVFKAVLSQELMRIKGGIRRHIGAGREVFFNFTL